MKTIALLVAFIGSGLASTLCAQPAYLNYQGRLSDAVGAPLDSGSYTLEFNIYDAANGGNKVWGPFLFDGNTGNGHAPRAVVLQGRFNVILGAVDTAARPLQDAFAGASRFVEIKVDGGAPITPRQQFLSTPYAFAVGNSNYELSPDALRAKSTNAVELGTGLANAPGSVSATTDSLRIAGAGSNAVSRRITLNGAVSVTNAAAGTPALSVTGDASFTGNLSSGGNATISGSLQAASLTDGNRTNLITDIIRDDPPLIIDATNFINTTLWQIKEVDLKKLGNDQDGCRIRLYLQHKTTTSDPDYDLAPVEQIVFFEQPGMTSNPNLPGQILMTVSQLNATGYGFIRLTLDGASKRLFSIYSGPWVWVSTFPEDSLNGGTNGAPDPTNKFKLWFHFHPHVSGRIMVFDN